MIRGYSAFLRLLALDDLLLRDLTNHPQQSTVIIKVEGETVNGEGTGFFITKNGIIATCAHVVKNADKITVIVNYKIDKGNYITKDYAAEVIAINEYDDVAIIGILSQNVNVSFYPLKSEKLGYPEPWSTKIIMGGYPFGASRFSNHISFSTP